MQETEIKLLATEHRSFIFVEMKRKKERKKEDKIRLRAGVRMRTPLA